MNSEFFKKIEVLKNMKVSSLKEKYREVFGEESRSNNKQFLFRRIAWRIQAIKEGDLSERARRQAEELARDVDLRIRAPRSFSLGTTTPREIISFSLPQDRRIPIPGTILTREYQGKTIRVMVLSKGFEYEGKIYRSLSALAKIVTNSHWNGFGFFNLLNKKEKDKTKER